MLSRAVASVVLFVDCVPRYLPYLRGQAVLAIQRTQRLLNLMIEYLLNACMMLACLSSKKLHQPT